ncbi:translation initiation factor IF-2 [Spirosoma sp. KCTC 42546]|uniref:translation initiation factor IF-2 n=1 Tax=Spirosoma sp. KCTC 42546 TaxID=2520506 RepID=UPI00115BEB28|nr:translation initiation factor IF-2 [Spirosoma sp. KCTC 42546]QDK78988.1 translation initiation factor IF-2 [Spirosoma sp. KCTC 42546]
MAEEKSMRLSQVAKILNKGLSSVAGSLSAKGFKVEVNPNTKINMEQLEVLAKEYKSTELLNGARRAEPPVAVAEPPRRQEEDVVLYRRDDARRPIVENKPESAPAELPKEAPIESKPILQTAQTGLPGLKVVGKIDLNAKPVIPAPPVPQAKVTPPQEVKPVDAPKPSESLAQPVSAPAPTPVVAEVPKPVTVQPPVAKPEVEAVKPVVPAQPAEVKPVPVAPVQVTPVQTSTPTVSAPPKEVPPVVTNTNPPAPVQAPVAKVEASQPVVTPEVQKPVARAEAPKPTVPVKPKSETPQAKPPVTSEEEAPTETIRAAGSHQLGGLKILGKIELPVNNPRQGGGNSNADKKKRKRIRGGREGAVGSTAQPNQGGGGQQQGQGGNNRNDRAPREGDRGPANRTPGDRPQGDRNQAGGNTAPRDGNNRPQGQGQGAPREGDRNQAPANRAGGGTGQNQGTNTANRGGQAGAASGNNANNNRTGGGNRAGGGGTGQGQNRGGGGNNANRGGGGRREAPTQADVRKAIQQTNARMQGNTPNRGADRRRDRRSQREEDRRLLNEQEELEAKILKVTEFVSANDLASLMDVSINEVISVCLNLGMFVSINQRLDAEAITVIADEFGYDVQFISAEDETEAGIDVEADEPDDLQPRAPIVTIMGHVDHGKTSLLDYIRRAKVAAGEAGGITQHIGAYSVKTTDDRMITFLDTPGHEAFTAMRARGAKVTDVVIIVIAADDSIMPQTREAINHAQVAGVPIVFAFSKVDKPGADAEKIRAELASMNMLVEEWGGKYQAQEISSKSGMGVDDLLEKVLLEAELLELKANPNRRALGTVIEASLDKGRGYVSTVLVENGTLHQGDIMLVGAHYGRIRAMTNDRGERIKEAGPATPVQILGLPGAPQAGDKFNVMETDREAREIANKREQLLREQTLRTRKHITLEEIGRRKAIGTFKELNVIVKGDVDGSVEALSDSLLQLSTEEVQVNIIHKAVGQISESDVLLASASDAVIVGFQVRPSSSARRLAEQEQIEIRLYSIIYDAINEVRDAMEGLLAPTVEEVIVGNIEVRDVFKISKIGTVAGCYVTEGNIKRNNKIRIIRDFIVIHTGEISALKRFKEDVSEVKFGYECGLSIKNFNDIEVGDVIESFELKEVKRTL